MPKRRSARIIISRVLIIVGAAFILFAAGYEAVGYPWRILFTDSSELNIDRLPDPTPPDVDYIDALLESWEDPYDNEPEPSASVAPSIEQPPSPDTPSGELPGQGDNYLNFDKAESKPKVSYPPAVLIGAVKIPKLDVSVNLVEGTGTRDLLVGAGHVSSTPEMGSKGNAVVAGHRVTRSMHPFRHLDKMEAGDTVILKNDSHTYTYSTVEWFIVKNTENWVMGKVEEIPYCLTLVTCHPVGSARERLILRAELIDIDGIPPEEFYSSPEPSAEG